MSREQGGGKPVAGRSDSFSAGAVLYEMFTGTRPFASDSTMGVLCKVMRYAPPPIRDLRADVPQAVERIVVRCLDKDPALRYPSGRELAGDLTGCRRPAGATAFSAGARVLSSVALIRSL